MSTTTANPDLISTPAALRWQDAPAVAFSRHQALLERSEVAQGFHLRPSERGPFLNLQRDVCHTGPITGTKRQAIARLNQHRPDGHWFPVRAVTRLFLGWVIATQVDDCAWRVLRPDGSIVAIRFAG